MKLIVQIFIIIAIILIGSHLVASGIAHTLSKLQFCAEMFALLCLSGAFLVTLAKELPHMDFDSEF